MSTETKKYESKLSPAQRSDLALDVQNTLKHKMSGIMAIWAYMNGGKEPLERLFRKENYHGEKEREFIEELAVKLAESPDFPKYNISLQDLGHGMAADKAISFMCAFNEAANQALPEGENPSNRFVEAIGIDIVEEYGEHYKEQVSAFFNEMAKKYDERPASVRSVTEKYADIKQPIEAEGDSTVMVSFNTPIWNSPLSYGDMAQGEILPKALKYAARIPDVGGYIVTNHYLHTTDDDELYNSDECREAVGAILKLIEKELNPSCYKRNEDGSIGEDKIPFSECFTYSTHYDSDTNSRRMDVVSKDNITIYIGDHFVQTMNRDERFCFVSAAKLGRKDFDKHVENTGIFESSSANKIAMRNESGDIFGYGRAIKVIRQPQL